MKRGERLYLPYTDWPEDDKALWITAFKAGADVFDDCGPGAHLAERSQLQLQYAYGKFLAFLAARHRSLLARAPAERLNRKIIEEYAKWQPASCGGVTLAIYLYHLWLVLKYLCPSEDWSWVLIISKRIKGRAKQKPQKHHLVTSETLFALGIELMDHVSKNGKAEKTRFMQTAYRDGLIIALLALIPLRRRTVAALRIGKHLVRTGKLWDLDIPAKDIKTKKPFESPIMAELSKRIDFYLAEIRSRIPRAGAHDYLWANSRGPMGDKMIYKAVCRRTKKALGFPVNLHRFRHAAATFWSIHDSF